KADALERLATQGAIPEHLARDPWCRQVRLRRSARPDAARPGTPRPAWILTSAGPDCMFDSSDDVEYHFAPGPGGWFGSAGYGVGSGRGGMRGRTSAVPQVVIGAAQAAPEGLALRRRFDETVL